MGMCHSIDNNMTSAAVLSEGLIHRRYDLTASEAPDRLMPSPTGTQIHS